MITSIPTEIQQLVLIKLPVDKNLVNAPWISEDAAFVQQHVQAAVDRKELEFSDWMSMPPFYRAACLSQDKFWRYPTIYETPREHVECAIRCAVMHRIITANAPSNPSFSNIFLNNKLKNILVWAAARGAVDAVRLLLRCGINTSDAYMDISPSILNAYPAFDPSIDSSAPLVLACLYGHSKVAELLLQDPRVDPNAVGMVHLLPAAENGHEDVVRLLLSEPRRDGDESEALVKASYAGHVRIVDLLLKDGRAEASWENSICLREACRQGHLAVVQLLLTSTDADINAYEISSDWLNEGTGHEDVVQLLLSDSKWDIEESGDTLCLRQACTEGHLVAVQLLLSITDVDINAYEVSDGNVLSALREARKKGHTDVVEYLLKDPRLDMDSIANKEHLRAAAGNGHEDVVRLLLSEPRRDGDESVALVEASKEGHVGVVKLLAKDGRAKGSWENSSCLRQACRRGHLAMVKRLLPVTDADINEYEIGTNPRDSGVSSPAREARGNWNSHVVEYLRNDPRLDMDSIANISEKKEERCPKTKTVHKSRVYESLTIEKPNSFFQVKV
ncbi:ankyrin repeat-containing domain protein [Chytriomyces cf. hyalinus JEL632]|nr:ankyrin repeat-containing domain protein [Chytriomyces cf. hyalinus JEL632]